MPEYEFVCQKCNNTFSEIMRVNEYEKKKGKIRCPKCKSRNVKQVITGFQVITSKKS